MILLYLITHPSIFSFFPHSCLVLVFCLLSCRLFCIPHVRENMQYLSFWVWLIFLNMIIFRSIHFLANDSISHFLYLFICLWAFRLGLYLGHCILCCNMHECAGISAKCWLWFLWIVPRSIDLDHMAFL